MKKFSGAEQRIIWTASYIKAADNFHYAKVFCNKVLLDFQKKGKIPISRQRYISVCVEYSENPNFRKELTSLGIKYRSYRIDDGYEFLIRKKDYHLYLIGTKIHNQKDFEHNIDLEKMQKDYNKEISA